MDDDLTDPSRIEVARELANDARAQLRSQGFDDDEIEESAQEFLAEHESGSVEHFVSWMSSRTRD